MSENYCKTEEEIAILLLNKLAFKAATLGNLEVVFKLQLSMISPKN
jgi:hypothetical protein